MLFEIASNELKFENQKKEIIETKAERFVSFGGTLFTIISAFFFIYLENLINKVYMIFLLGSSLFLLASILFSIISLKTYKYSSIDIRKLIIKCHDWKSDDFVKHYTGNLVEAIESRRDINIKKSKALKKSIILFFISLLFLIIAILLFILNL